MTGVPSFKEIGACEIGELRPRLLAVAVQPARVEDGSSCRHVYAESIGDVFNLTNAINPAFSIGAASSVGASTRARWRITRRTRSS